MLFPPRIYHTNPHTRVMNDPAKKRSIPGNALLTTDDLRPSLLLTLGQIMIAFLGAVLITNGLLM